MPSQTGTNLSYSYPGDTDSLAGMLFLCEQRPSSMKRYYGNVNKPKKVSTEEGK